MYLIPESLLKSGSVSFCVREWPRQQGLRVIAYKGFAPGPSLLQIVIALDDRVLSPADQASLANVVISSFKRCRLAQDLAAGKFSLIPGGWGGVLSCLGDRDKELSVRQLQNMA